MKKALSTEDPGSAQSILYTSQFDFQKEYTFESSHNRAFFKIDLSKIIDQYHLWNQELPFVKPYYAIKCNPNPEIIRLLASLGCSFDCASAGEIKTVREITKDPKKIIYANPIKGSDHINFAKEVGVDLMTFDCQEELIKIKSLAPNSRLIMRIAVDDSHSVCKFNTKFGCEKEEAKLLLKFAKEIDLNVVGISFHVGSGCQNPDVYRSAIMDSREMIQYGQQQGHNMQIIDLGGGYPGNNKGVLFADIANVIRNTYNTYKDLQKLEWIAEPGRYMVTNSHTLVTEIIGVKQSTENIRYYLNEGVYMSLSGMMFDYQVPGFRYERRDTSDTNLYPSTFFGPTCDSLDKIGVYQMPKLQVGDSIIFDEIGDYSIASATTFNGFQKAKLQYFCSNKEHQKYISTIGRSLI